MGSVIKHKALPRLLLLGAFAWVAFVPTVDLVRDWLRDPNYTHGFLIVAVSAFLVWRRRKEIGRVPRSSSWVGLAALVACSALFILGVAGAEVFTQRVALLGMSASLIMWFHGWGRFKLIAFPLAFLLLAIPLPYVIYYGLTAPMQRLAAHAAVVGLNAVGIPALREGNMIHLAQGSLEVAEACSGIRSLYAFLAVGALAAAFTPIPLWGRIAVLLTTIPVAIAGNAIRVWISGVGTHTGRLWAAHGTMHEVFGLLTFLLMLGLFLLFRKVARLLWSPGTFSRSASSAPLGRTPD